ncbi:MAG: glycosyltransferase [Hyphomicrobiales bacterium]
MISETPLITIGITCFNAEETISRAIESASKQDWENFEIIVVDDCSNDNSIIAIEEIQNRDKRVRLYCHEKNQGYPTALNTIIKHAQGEFIAFFDDDDDNETDRLSKQYQKLTQFNKLRPGATAFCYTHRRVFVNGEEKPHAFVNAIGATAPEPNGTAVVDFLLWHKKAKGFVWGEFGSCTLMAPTAVLKKFGFDANFRRGAEWDLAIRFALQGGYFIAVDEPLVIQHKTPTSDKAGRKPLDYALMLRKKHKNYLQQNHVYLGAILQAYSRFYYFRNKLWKSRFYLVLACVLSPKTILADEISKRVKN